MFNENVHPLHFSCVLKGSFVSLVFRYFNVFHHVDVSQVHSLPPVETTFFVKPQRRYRELPRTWNEYQNKDVESISSFRFFLRRLPCSRSFPCDLCFAAIDPCLCALCLPDVKLSNTFVEGSTKKLQGILNRLSREGRNVDGTLLT